MGFDRRAPRSSDECSTADPCLIMMPLQVVRHAYKGWARVSDDLLDAAELHESND